MSAMTLANLGVGLAALLCGLAMLAVTLKRHRRDHRANDPRGVAMLIAGMMATAFGLFITAFAIAYATAEQPQ